MGTLQSQYKQIGNAVPVNLAYAIGRSLIRLMNDIDRAAPEKSNTSEAVKAGQEIIKTHSLF